MVNYMFEAQEESFVCRYCGIPDTQTDIYIVSRNCKFEGFCLRCYEINLDDKRKRLAMENCVHCHKPTGENYFIYHNHVKGWDSKYCADCVGLRDRDKWKMI